MEEKCAVLTLKNKGDLDKGNYRCNIWFDDVDREVQRRSEGAE